MTEIKKVAWGTHGHPSWDMYWLYWFKLPPLWKGFWPWHSGGPRKSTTQIEPNCWGCTSHRATLGWCFQGAAASDKPDWHHVSKCNLQSLFPTFLKTSLQPMWRLVKTSFFNDGKFRWNWRPHDHTGVSPFARKNLSIMENFQLATMDQECNEIAIKRRHIVVSPRCMSFGKSAKSAKFHDPYDPSYAMSSSLWGAAAELRRRELRNSPQRLLTVPVDLKNSTACFPIWRAFSLSPGCWERAFL